MPTNEFPRSEAEKAPLPQIPNIMPASRSNRVKDMLIFIGAILAVFVVGFLALNFIGNDLDNKSRNYIDLKVPAIVSDWSSQEFIDLASPGFFEAVSEEKVVSAFKIYSDKLGKLKKYEGSEGEAKMHLEIICEEGVMCFRVTGDYVSEATFEKGSATIKTKIVLVGGKWEIYGFSVLSDAFLKSAEENRSEIYLKKIYDAKKYYGEKKYDQSLGKAREALLEAKIDEEKIEAHYWIGLSQFRLNNAKEAEIEYMSALSIDPDYAPAYSSLSAVYNRSGKFEQAVASAEKAIRIDSNYAWAHNNLASAYVQIGKLSEAVQEFKTAISIEPGVPDFHFNLAIAYASGSSVSEAIDEYNETIRIDPKFEGAYVNLGNLYNAQGDREKAKETFQKGVENMPESPLLHYELGLVYARMNSVELYEKEMKLAIESNKNYVQAYLTLFEFYAHSDEMEKLKSLARSYLEATGKSKEMLENEINEAGWMKSKAIILKAVDEI